MQRVACAACRNDRTRRVHVCGLDGDGRRPRTLSRDVARRARVRSSHAIAQAPVYLPVDRVFSLTGRGTIVTGTLMQGTIAVGDTLASRPARPARARTRAARLRRMRGSACCRGSRVALNLSGIERARARTRRGRYVRERRASRAEYAVRFFAVDDDALALLRRRTPVRAHIGSAEILGTLVFEAAPDDLRERHRSLVSARAGACVSRRSLRRAPRLAQDAARRRRDRRYRACCRTSRPRWSRCRDARFLRRARRGAGRSGVDRVCRQRSRRRSPPASRCAARSRRGRRDCASGRLDRRKRLRSACAADGVRAGSLARERAVGDGPDVARALAHPRRRGEHARCVCSRRWSTTAASPRATATSRCPATRRN